MDYIKATEGAGIGVMGAQRYWTGNNTTIQPNRLYKTKEQVKALAAVEQIAAAVPKRFTELEKLEYAIAMVSMYPSSYETGYPTQRSGLMSDQSAESHMYGKFVCAGSAQFGYLLLKKMGFDVKVVAGFATGSLGDVGGLHAWLIVKYNNKWYHSDPLWAATGYQGKTDMWLRDGIFLMGEDNYWMQKRSWDKNFYEGLVYSKESIDWRGASRFGWTIPNKGDIMFHYKSEDGFTQEELAKLKSIVY